MRQLAHWLGGGLLAFAVGGLVSCGPPSTFACQSNAQCGDGTCEPSGFCSFPDGECESGRRYGSLAGDSLGGACVDVLPSGSTGDGTTSTTTDASSTSTTQVGSTGSPAECGNGVVEDGEDCDDGNDIIADGCNLDCFESGSVVWSVVHDTPDDAASRYNAVTMVEGDPVVVGYVETQAADRNGLLLRYDSDGGVTWSQTVDAEGLYDELSGVSYDGQRIAAAGQATVTDPDTMTQDTVVWLVITEAGGSVPGQFTGDPGRARDIESTANGFLLVGQLSAGDVPWAGEFQPDGTELLSVTSMSAGSGVLSAAAVGSDGRMFAVGRRATANGEDFVVDEVTAMGLVSVATLSGAFDNADGQGLAMTSAGDLWAGGYVQAGADSLHRNWLARRYRTTGDVVSEDEWTQPGSMLSDELQSIAIDPAGDVIAAGFTNASGNVMMMVRRYSPSGAIRWTQTYDYGSDSDILRGVTVDDSGAIYVVGEVTENDGQLLGWLAQLRP